MAPFHLLASEGHVLVDRPRPIKGLTDMTRSQRLGAAALAGIGIHATLAFVIDPSRSRGTGPRRWVPLRESPPLERCASALIGVGVLCQVIAAASLATGRRQQRARSHPWGGATLFAGGMVLTVTARRALGSAWSTSVVGTGAMPLVTGGPYQLVRHPVYTAFFGSTGAVVMLAPSWPTVAGAALLTLGLQLQVRRVEEPALTTAYGEQYQRYAASAGRFLPRTHAGPPP